MPSYQSFLSAVKAEVKETDVQAVKPLLDDPGYDDPWFSASL